MSRPEPSDIKFANTFTYESIEKFYPKVKFFENSRINTKNGMRVYELFTPRNLLALSELYNEINNLKDTKIRDLFRLCFTGALGQSSKMVFVIKRRSKNGKSGQVNKQVGSWVIGYWIPDENFEINVWNCFENRFKRILKAKTELSDKDYKLNFANSYDELNKNKNISLKNTPAQLELKKLPDDSVDYVITDPPHGNRQPYLELSTMWNSWLDFDVNFKDEIVISGAKDRDKDVEDYIKLLEEAFSEIVRVLKPQHYFSLMFNSMDDQTWLRLFKILHNLNLKFTKIETLDYSANSVVQDTRKSGLQTDFIMTFKKIQNPKSNNNVNYEIDENKITKLVDQAFVESETKELRTFEILNYIFKQCFYGNEFISIDKVVNVLKENYTIKDNYWRR